MNLLFSINQKFIPLWEQCMATILRHGGAVRYDVYVLHSDLTAEDGARMRAALRPQDSCTLVEVPDGLSAADLLPAGRAAAAARSPRPHPLP